MSLGYCERCGQPHPRCEGHRVLLESVLSALVSAEAGCSRRRAADGDTS